MKPLKIQHLFNNPQKYGIYSVTQKIQQLWQVPKKYRFLESKTQKSTPLIPVCEYAKSTPGRRVFSLPCAYQKSLKTKYFLKNG